MWGDRIYVTAPRWHGNSHPLNLGELDRRTSDLPLSSPVRPFPSWEMQRLGDCNSFQFVQSMEAGTMLLQKYFLLSTLITDMVRDSVWCPLFVVCCLLLVVCCLVFVVV